MRWFGLGIGIKLWFRRILSFRMNLLPKLYMLPCLFWLFRPLFVHWWKKIKKDESASTRSVGFATRQTYVLFNNFKDLYGKIEKNCEKERTYKAQKVCLFPSSNLNRKTVWSSASNRWWLQDSSSCTWLSTKNETSVDSRLVCVVRMAL